jgi:hypothetical protein
MNFVLAGELSAKLGDSKPLALKDGRYHTYLHLVIKYRLSLRAIGKMFAVCLTRKFISKLIGKEL